LAVHDGEYVTLTSKQVQGAVLLFTVTLLVLIVLGTALRPERSPSDDLEAAIAAASPRSGASTPVMTPELERGMEALFGGGRISTLDPSALNKSLGEPVVLQMNETTWRVTPTRVTAATSACAAGPLMSVELLVKLESGSEALPLNNFHLMTADGADAAPIPACSTGFAEFAVQRTLVFAATGADRLIVGKDAIASVAAWQVP
jgi:hypothetical protein